MGAPAEILGRSIRAAREEAEKTQEELARAAGMGTSTLRSIEAGTAKGPSLYTVLNLLSVLGKDTSELDPLMPPPSADEP